MVLQNSINLPAYFLKQIKTCHHSSAQIFTVNIRVDSIGSKYKQFYFICQDYFDITELNSIKILSGNVSHIFQKYQADTSILTSLPSTDQTVCFYSTSAPKLHINTKFFNIFNRNAEQLKNKLYANSTSTHILTC